MPPPSHSLRPAITLVQTLVVSGIVGMMLGLLLVSIQQVRGRTNQASCQVNLKNLVFAVHVHHVSKGKMPPYASGRPKEIYGGWYIHLLPFVGREQLYREFQINQISEEDGLTVATTGMDLPEVQNAVFPELACRADPTRSRSDNRTNYLANWYALSDGIRGTYRAAQSFESLTNGLSSVVLFAEGYSNCSDLPRLALFSANYHNFGITQEGMPSDDPWYAPENYLMFQVKPEKCERWRAQTPHEAMHVGVADGSTRSVSGSISLETWTHVVKARTGGTPGPDW